MLLQELDEVGVLSHDDDVGMTCGRENLMVRRTLEIQITNRQAFDGGRGTTTRRAPGEVDCRARASRGDDGMIKTPAREAQTRRHVARFQIRQLLEHLFR
jgi:hypothetical protein